MAEAIAAARMRERALGGLAVSSAGMAALDGMRAAPNAVKVLAENGIDLSGHRSRMLTKEMVDAADLVVAMTEEHRSEILELAPGSAGKVVVLGELDHSRGCVDIPDPIGGDMGVYRETRDEISSLITRLIDYVIEIFGLKQ